MRSGKPSSTYNTAATTREAALASTDCFAVGVGSEDARGDADVQHQRERSHIGHL